MDQVFIARRRAEFVLYKSTLYSVLKIVLPFVLVYFFKAFGIVSSWGIAAVIGSFIGLFPFLPRVVRGYRIKLKIDLYIIKSVWRYSSGNYFFLLLLAAPGYILPLLVVNRLGAEENAFFGMAWMIAGLLFVIPHAVSQSLFAEGSHFEEKLDDNVRRSYKFIFILLIPAIALLLACGKWILLAFGESYSENALPLLQVLALSGIFMGINSVYYTILQVERKIAELVIINGIIALIVLIGSYLTIPETGIVGVGYVWFAVQGVLGVYIIVRMIKRHRQRIKTYLMMLN
jgi:O-antigen/teichoic acid export membrane protein